MMRVDRVQVVVDGYIEFEGPVHINMDWQPAPDDSLVALLLERNEQMQRGELLAKGVTEIL